MPVGFVGHGSPLLVYDESHGAALAAWARELPRKPSAILIVSAHWEDAPLTLSSTRAGTPLIYDFYGFPAALYQFRHDAPPAPALAQRVTDLLGDWLPRWSDRGLDHGAWTVLHHFDREAQIPTLQVSMPRTASLRDLARMGEALAPLRDEDVWILGSGNITHNLRRMSSGAAPAAWAQDFDGWVADALSSGNTGLLFEPERAPGWAMSHPTPDHYRPLLVAAGATKGDVVRYPVVGFNLGSLSLRSVEFG
jgi:4,5-DOPA dioxygenase extradiol